MIWDTLIPSDSVYRLMRDFAPLLIKKEDFAGLYCENNGRSSIEALKMTMACMIQQMLDETDRGMEWLTQVNLDIKYALFMSLEEKGIDHANFHNHRQRLMEKKLDVLEQLVEQIPVDLVENVKIIWDTHYGSAEHRKAMEDKGIAVSAPLSDTVKIAKLIEEGFSINNEHEKLMCPNGRCFTKYNEVDNGRNFYLGAKDCKTCSRYSECFKGKKKRIVFIHNLFEVIEKAEKYNRTEDYRNDMRLRSRIESKQNELANTYGLRRVRYIGERKLAFAARMKALATNFQKLKRLLNTGKYSKSHLSDRLSEYGKVV
jgi:hypothetical protein